MTLDSYALLRDDHEQALLMYCEHTCEQPPKILFMDAMQVLEVLLPEACKWSETKTPFACPEGHHPKGTNLWNLQKALQGHVLLKGVLRGLCGGVLQGLCGGPPDSAGLSLDASLQTHLNVALETSAMEVEVVTILGACTGQ